jgi:hypothetical protein
MKRKIYFTVTKGVEDDGETLDGMKTVSVYEIIDNEPKLWFDVETPNEQPSDEAVAQYLNDNGFGDEAFDAILL